MLVHAEFQRPDRIPAQMHQFSVVAGKNGRLRQDCAARKKSRFVNRAKPRLRRLDMEFQISTADPARKRESFPSRSGDVAVGKIPVRNEAAYPPVRQMFAECDFHDRSGGKFPVECFQPGIFLSEIENQEKSVESVRQFPHAPRGGGRPGGKR